MFTCAFLQFLVQIPNRFPGNCTLYCTPLQFLCQSKASALSFYTVINSVALLISFICLSQFADTHPRFYLLPNHPMLLIASQCINIKVVIHALMTSMSETVQKLRSYSSASTTHLLSDLRISSHSNGYTTQKA